MSKLPLVPVAISVQDVSKTFRIPHERVDTLRGRFIHMFRKTPFEEFRALDHVSFSIQKGEFIGIIGRNGSGKSTLLKILAGIYTPDQGKITVDGAISPFLELGIGFHPELSGRDNIYLNGSVLGLSRKEIDEKFNEIVSFSELERFIDQKLKNYSSGMQVRLAFSVAIHANKDILLMDEVLAVGDSNFQAKCFEKFHEYIRQKKTVVFVTHDIGLVQRYCNRALLLKDGQLIKIGKTEPVISEYLYQNMTDEELRLEEQRKHAPLPSSSSLSTVGKKPIAIHAVRLFNDEDKEKYVFQTGEPLKITVAFTSPLHSLPPKINVGIGIYSEDGIYLLGYNTQMDGFTPTSTDALSLSFEELPLLKGKYYINVVVFGDNESTYFDFVSRAKEFTVFSGGHTSLYRGILHLKHSWIS